MNAVSKNTVSKNTVSHRFRFWVILFGILFVLHTAAGGGAMHGTLHGQEWRPLHSENGGTLVAQNHLVPQNNAPSVPQNTQNSSVLTVQLPTEQSAVILGQAIGNPLVIDDLTPAIPVKADAAGIAVGVQVVLPKTIHPVTKRPISYIVPGSKYSGSKNWETLGFRDKNGLPNLRKESDRIAALLQAELKTSFGTPFDMRGQYVRQIILYAERLPQQNAQKTIHIEPVKITGFAAADFAAGTAAAGADDNVMHTENRNVFDPLNYAGFKIQATAKPVYPGGNTDGNTEWVSPLQTQTAEPLQADPHGTRVPVSAPRERIVYDHQQPKPFALLNGQNNPHSQNGQNEPVPSPTALMRIKMNDGVLMLDDIPTGIRAVEYQGEPLDFLRKLEFNAVWLKETPGPELRLDAQKAGIWLICPPPGNTELEAARKFDPNAMSPSMRGHSASMSALDSTYDNVLIWNLGSECSYARHLADSQRAQVVQSADRIKRRPMLCTARSGVYDYSRTVDVLMLTREPLFSSLDLLDLYRWQKEYQTLARPDTAFWTTIQTQPPPKLAEQWTMFEGNPQFICAVSYEQIKMQMYSALASGMHGVLFNSYTPLTNNDPETEFRRTALELANWELQLAEEWFASGRALPALAQSNLPAVQSAVVQSGRSRLLVPMQQERQNQSSVGAAAAGNVRYIVSGIPETYNAYHLVPGRLLPLETRRVAGGMQIELEEASVNSLIFFSEDDAVYAQIGQRAKIMGSRAAFLACRLAELQLSMTEQVLAALKRAKEMKAVPVHPKDNLPLMALPEQESMIRATKEALNFAKDLAGRNPPDHARSYLQAERATRGLRFTGRRLWLEATRHDLNACMTPVSVSFATLPLYLTAYQRTNGAKLGANRLPGGNMETRTIEQAGWEPMSHKVEGVFVAKKDISPAAQHSGQTGLQLVVAPSNPSDKPKQLETVPLWIAAPPMPVRRGEMLCVHGWLRIPKALESTADGFMIFDSLGGEALALRFLETNNEWKEFAFYRNVPADSNYYLFFALAGIGEVHLDDVQVCAVQFETKPPDSGAAAPPAGPAPASPPSSPFYRRLNPLQYLPPMPNWGN